MRNSSLVEWRCAENVTGLKLKPKLRMYAYVYVVEEHPVKGEAIPEGVVDITGERMLE